jgi:hypothetical protein
LAFQNASSYQKHCEALTEVILGYDQLMRIKDGGQLRDGKSRMTRCSRTCQSGQSLKAKMLTRSREALYERRTIL